MNNNQLIDKKLAVLVANGFCEDDLTQMQRVLQVSGLDMRIISMDNGLVSSWRHDGWGLHFAADYVLSSALAADFSMLAIPGGKRSIEKLKLTAHTRRFISGFLDSRKPVVAFDAAVDLIAFSGKIAGRTIIGPENLKADLIASGAVWSEDDCVMDGNLLTGITTAENKSEYIRSVSEFLVSSFDMSEAA